MAGKGWGGKGGGQAPPAGDAASFAAGEAVNVFYRYEYDGSTDGAEAYFPVATPLAGSLKPRMGKTACWQEARVVAPFAQSAFDPSNVIGPNGTGVLVELSYPLWFNRAGHALDVSSPKNTQVRVHPRDVVRGAAPTPDVSFVVIRWGGHVRTPDYNELPGEEGGWGRIGTSISDGYIQAVFDRVYERLGHVYEVLSVYVSGTHDLQRVTASAVLPQLSGRTFAGCYFLWPIAFGDQANPVAGYVEKNAFFNVMQELECAGCETAFPHHAFLYNMLISKDWCSYTSGHKDMKTPATTKVMRSLVERNAGGAAEECLAALSQVRGAPVRRGVCKLGYSWEASDVMSFDGAADLGKKLLQLVRQNGCLADNVIVQEFIESDMEIRVFVVGGVPIHFLYTKFCTNTPTGSFTAFRCARKHEAVYEWFGGDAAAMVAAETEILRLTDKWVTWLRGVCAKPLSFLRLDFFVKRTGPGATSVHIGELTEMGASCLGWAEGWTAQFDAVVHAATGTPFPALARVDPHAPPPLPPPHAPPAAGGDGYAQVQQWAVPNQPPQQDAWGQAYQPPADAAPPGVHAPPPAPAFPMPPAHHAHGKKGGW